MARTFKLVALIMLSLMIAGSIYFVVGTEKPVRIRVTTTTSLYATGLLEHLAAEYKKLNGDVEIDFIAVGSGEALRRAERGDACMVFTHAPNLEKEYYEKGVIVDKRIFAYNYFIIVGPENDPAGIRGSSSAVEAFKKIYAAGESGVVKFISRGDNSGTHAREIMIWNMAGLDPRGRDWYLESGQGMSQTLVMASQLQAYTLSDSGTYLKLHREGTLPGLAVLYSNSTELINIYSIYIVDSCTGEERKVAEDFADFVYRSQDIIGGYGISEYGEPLFYPAEDMGERLENIWRQLADIA